MEKEKNELIDLPDTHQVLIQVTSRDLKRVISTAINKAVQAYRSIEKAKSNDR